MEIIIKIDTNVPVTDKDKFFISFLNDVYNGKKTLDDIMNEDQVGDVQETWSPPSSKEVEQPESDTEEEEPPKPDVDTCKKSKYKNKVCVDCKKVYTPKSGRSERCPECTEKHKQKLTQKQRERQTARRRAAKQKIVATQESVNPVKKEPERPKVVPCRNCHRPYVPAPDDHNFYCPKCVEKLRSRPRLQPIKKTTTDLSVEEVLKLPVVDRYKYAYMWSYAERQRALSMKPVSQVLDATEAEFWRRCATGDFMED